MNVQDIITANGEQSACDFRCFLFTSPNRVGDDDLGTTTWHECKLYRINYEEETLSIYYFDKNRGYLFFEYYFAGFIKKIEEGSIVIKTNSNQFIDRVQWVEFIPNTIAYIEHEADILVGVD